MRQIVLDTETTGLSVETGDRLIEIGCVELLGRKRSGNNLHFYVNPGRDSHPDALKVHGISNAFLQQQPGFSAIAEELMAYLKGAELIIHNAPFDVGFLNKEFALLGQPPLAQWVSKITDSLLLAKEIFPGKRNSLDALCERLEVDHSGRTLHGALLDAELLAEVYINLTRGQNSLVMDAGEAASSGAAALPALDLRGFDLPVLAATPAECQAHQQVLVDLDKVSHHKTLWRLLPA